VGDTIFDLDDDEDATAAGLNGKPAAGTVTLTTEQWESMKQEQADLKANLLSVNQKLEDTTRMLSNSTKPAPATPQDPSSMSSDDAIKLFAADPSKFTTMVADGRISKAIAEQLGPLLTPIIQTTHQSILQSKRAAFDTRFGVGKFDEIILPDLQRDLDQLSKSNSNSLGDQATMEALVDRIQGQKRTELNQAEQALTTSRDEATKADVARVVSALPPSMQPKPAGGIKELPEEAKTMLDEIERATGERPDEKRFIAVHNAGPGLGGYVKAISELEGAGNKNAGSGA